MCSDVEIWRHGALELWSRAADVGTRRCSGGGLVARCTCIKVEVCRYGALEASCRCSDVEG